MKIQVWKTFKHTLSNVWNHKLEWARVVYAPIVLLIAAGGLLLATNLLNTETLTAFSTLALVDTLLVGIAVLVGLTAFLQLTIKSFRYALLGEGSDTWFSFPLKGRLLKLALYLFLFSLINGLLLGIPGGLLVYMIKTLAEVFRGEFILDPTGIATYTVTACLLTPLLIGAFYVVARLWFYSLFISIETHKPFRSSWHLLKGNVWRFVGLYLLLSLAIGAISMLFQAGEWISLAWSIPILPSVFYGAHLLVSTALTAVIISKGSALVYQELGEGRRLK